MNCPYCGTGNPGGTRFCAGCGANIEGASPASPQPPAQTYQTNYAPPPPPPYQSIPAVNPLTAPMRTSEFFWMILVLAIPLVGFICSLVWAFGSNVNENRKNFCRAQLIWVLVGIVLSILYAVLIASLGLSFFDALSNSYY